MVLAFARGAGIASIMQVYWSNGFAAFTGLSMCVEARDSKGVGLATVAGILFS
jgi:hypothetical protein